MSEMNYSASKHPIFFMFSTSVYHAVCTQQKQLDYSNKLVVIKNPCHVVYLPSPGDEGDACIGRPGKHKHYDNHEGDLGQLPFSSNGLLLDQARLPHLRPQLHHISVWAGRKEISSNTSSIQGLNWLEYLMQSLQTGSVLCNSLDCKSKGCVWVARLSLCHWW